MRKSILTALVLALAAFAASADRFLGTQPSMIRVEGTSTLHAWTMESSAIKGQITAPTPDNWNAPAKAVVATLEAGGLRVSLDARVEKIGYKIREAQLQQVPYMLVMGDREVAEGQVAVRSRRGGDLGARSVDQFLDDARREVQQKGR
jgi:histidyl-tRNA synthetase